MRFVLILLASILASGCQSAYYAAMEKVGVEKRDILVDRVEDAKDAQEEVRIEAADIWGTVSTEVFGVSEIW